MENWGLATYRESRLLFDANYSTQYEKQRAAGTNAHELLHMVRQTGHTGAQKQPCNQY